MNRRDQILETFLNGVEQAVLARASGPPAAAARRVFQRIAAITGAAGEEAGERLPVCGHLEAAFAGMADAGPPLAGLARGFAAIEGRLRWARRKGSEPGQGAFHDGHANAMIVGPGGIEQREDVWVGVTLMAPGAVYPDHSHPPEEVYLAFTDGAWWNAAMPWTSPGPGGLIYNPPGIMHAMRAGPVPFLAIWLLPIG